MTTDFRALCKELTNELHGYASANPYHDSDELVARARAALAAEAEGEELRFDGGYESGSMWTGHPLRPAALAAEPEPPADGEVAEVVTLIREGVAQCIEDFPEEAGMMTRAADLLERLVPQPVPEWPTDEDIMALMPPQMHEDLTAAARALAGFDSPKGATGAIRNILNCHAVDHARAVLARWGQP